MDNNIDINAVIVDNSSNSVEIIKNYLSEYNDISVKQEFTSFEENIEYIRKNKINLLIIDISDKEQDYLSEISSLIKTDKSVKVIAILSNPTSSNIVNALRAGVKEVLTKPLVKKEFMKVIDKVRKSILEKSSEENSGKIITTFSNKGGIGKTAIAVNLALEIAKFTHEKVALVDLNLQLGDVTTFLDLNPTFDISYVMQNSDKLNEEFLLSSMAQYEDTGLYVLADAPYIEQTDDISPYQIKNLLSALKKTFSYIVVDTGSVLDDKIVATLDASDLILLIAIVNLPALRNCQRCLDLFGRLGYEKEKTQIILNRYMDNDEIKTEDVEKVLDRKVYWKIPNNYFTIMSAINKGVPVSYINNESNISQSFKDLAMTLTESEFITNSKYTNGITKIL